MKKEKDRKLDLVKFLLINNIKKQDQDEVNNKDLIKLGLDTIK